MKPEIYIKKIIDSTGLTKSKIEELKDITRLLKLFQTML